MHSVFANAYWLRKGFQSCKLIFTVNHLLVGTCHTQIPHLLDIHSSEHTINAQNPTEKQRTGARAPGSLSTWIGTHSRQPFTVNTQAWRISEKQPTQMQTYLSVEKPRATIRSSSHINQSVVNLRATAHSDANIPERGETPSNNSLKFTHKPEHGESPSNSPLRCKHT